MRHHVYNISSLLFRHLDQALVLSHPLNKAAPVVSRVLSNDLDLRLPKSATVLQNDSAAKVVVLGTVHFSRKSVDEVSEIVHSLRPNAIVVELCRQRVSLLELDDKKFLEDAKKYNAKKFTETVKEHKGVVSGMLHAMLLKTYADLAKELGVAPGGEFRRAYQEMKKIPGCKLFLGDRPIQITLSRAFQSLNVLEIGQVFYHLSKSNQKPLDKSQIEKYKNKEYVQTQFDEIIKEVPAFKKIFHVFVDERDRCLAYSLQECVRSVKNPRVLAVVGMGHVNGIARYYGKMKQEDIVPLLLVPRPSLISWFKTIENKENDCGCTIDRTKEKKYRHIFFNTLEKEVCPVNNKIINTDRNVIGYNMVLISGGDYYIGTDDVIIESDKEGPERIVKLEPFYLDKYEVSNRDFNHFTKLTNYKTEAETFGDSFVFGMFLNNTLRDKFKDFRVVQAPWWYKIFGADWKHPHGPDSNILDVMDHPVVHISWNDANTYCKWRGARLPSEAEWEVACRGGHRSNKYPWGDKLFPNKKHMANIWQGTFPNYNSEKDGYVGTNPIYLFAQNDFGLHNMAGNVWEWTEDSWSDPKEKVKKGGSYLCHRSYCYRYRCSARSHNTEDSSAGNLGFRCAKSI